MSLRRIIFNLNKLVEKKDEIKLPSEIGTFLNLGNLANQCSYNCNFGYSYLIFDLYLYNLQNCPIVIYNIIKANLGLMIYKINFNFPIKYPYKKDIENLYFEFNECNKDRKLKIKLDLKNNKILSKKIIGVKFLFL